jgi:hypothetical protein
LNFAGQKTDRACRVSNAAPLARNCRVRANGSRNGFGPIGICRVTLSSKASTLGCGDIIATMGSMELQRPLSLLRLGHEVCIQVAQSAWREAAEFQLGTFHPDPGGSPHRAPPHYRGETSKIVRLRARLARKRVQPRNRMREHCTSGTVRGAPGHRRPYRRDAFGGSRFEPRV